MALHEVNAYPNVLNLGNSIDGFRFLQNHSAYWGAALLGGTNAALAFGGAAAFFHAALPSEMVAAITRFEVTCFGSVPSVLAHFGPEDVPGAPYLDVRYADLGLICICVDVSFRKKMHLQILSDLE